MSITASKAKQVIKNVIQVICSLTQTQTKTSPEKQKSDAKRNKQLIAFESMAKGSRNTVDKMSAVVESIFLHFYEENIFLAFKRIFTDFLLIYEQSVLCVSYIILVSDAVLDVTSAVLGHVKDGKLGDFFGDVSARDKDDRSLRIIGSLANFKEIYADKYLFYVTIQT